MTQSTAKTAQAYRFSVDGKTYESPKQVITGEELRKIARVEPHLRIFLGDHGPHSPDHAIALGTMLDLAQQGTARFYTLAPPSLDIY